MSQESVCLLISTVLKKKPTSGSEHSTLCLLDVSKCHIKTTSAVQQTNWSTKINISAMVPSEVAYVTGYVVIPADSGWLHGDQSKCRSHTWRIWAAAVPWGEWESWSQLSQIRSASTFSVLAVCLICGFALLWNWLQQGKLDYTLRLHYYNRHAMNLFVLSWIFIAQCISYTEPLRRFPTSNINEGHSLLRFPFSLLCKPQTQPHISSFICSKPGFWCQNTSRSVTTWAPSKSKPDYAWSQTQRDV